MDSPPQRTYDRDEEEQAHVVVVVGGEVVVGAQARFGEYQFGHWTEEGLRVWTPLCIFSETTQKEKLKRKVRKINDNSNNNNNNKKTRKRGEKMLGFMEIISHHFSHDIISIPRKVGRTTLERDLVNS